MQNCAPSALGRLKLFLTTAGSIPLGKCREANWRSSSPWQKWFVHSAASGIRITMSTACEGMGSGTQNQSWIAWPAYANRHSDGISYKRQAAKSGCARECAPGIISGGY